jgi:hypothetical protein
MGYGEAAPRQACKEPGLRGRDEAFKKIRRCFVMAQDVVIAVAATPQDPLSLIGEALRVLVVPLEANMETHTIPEINPDSI